MASKGNKRTLAGAAAPQKKSRVDPMFAGIVAALQGADGLSEKCRDMLVAMASPSLSASKGERHSTQQLGVDMIEETLNAHKTKLDAAVEGALKELSDLEGSKGTLLQRLDGVKASLEQKQAAKTAACAAHEAAKAATKSAEVARSEAMELQAKADASQAALEREKTGIDAAYQEHFKTPMDANECPHYSALKPFVQSLGLEDSLTNALPSSCEKTKEQRGTFDELVLTELGKAFAAKIDGLEKSLVNAASEISQHKAGVVSTGAVLEEKQLSEKTAAAEVEVATAAQREAEVEVSQVTEDWSTFEPRVLEATGKHNLVDAERMDFEAGALKDFAALRDQEKDVQAPVEIEAGPMGA